MGQGGGMAGHRPGPDPTYQEVRQVSLRTERAHVELYQRRAAAAGLPLNQYLAAVLAAAHGIDWTISLPPEHHLSLGA